MGELRLEGMYALLKTDPVVVGSPYSHHGYHHTILDILHDVPIRAPVSRIHVAVTSPSGLNAGWTLRSSGKPVAGSEYELYFGPQYEARAVVVEANQPESIAWRLARAEPDWVAPSLVPSRESGEFTQVRFGHIGSRNAGEHFRTSTFCWVMYLRLLKRYVETGEVVSCEKGLEA